MFRGWSRYFWLDITNSPSVVIRWRFWAMKRARISGGRLAVCETSQRTTALLFTLLTFCPPGPALRANDNENSDNGTLMMEVTTRNLPSSIGSVLAMNWY